MRDRIIEILEREIDDCDGNNCDKYYVSCSECEREQKDRIGKVADEIIGIMELDRIINKLNSVNEQFII